MSDSIWAVLPAAGSGSRMGAAVKKQFLTIQGRPMLSVTLQAFLDHPQIEGVIIVTGADDIPMVRDILPEHQKPVIVTAGGATRQQSVYCGLKALPETCAMVLIHDAARPMVSQALISSCIEGVRTYGTAIAATPVKDTIKEADASGKVLGTPDRSSLYAVQTPQAFSCPALLAAHQKAALQGVDSCTDDGAVMEAFGDLEVYLIPGDYRNIKVTTPEDLILAEAFLNL